MRNVEYGDRDVALPNEILRSVVGSGVHGIAIAGTDDHDEMGIYIEPPEYVLAVEIHRQDYVWRTQPEGVRSGAGPLLPAEVPSTGDQGQPDGDAPVVRARGVDHHPDPTR